MKCHWTHLHGEHDWTPLVADPETPQVLHLFGESVRCPGNPPVYGDEYDAGIVWDEPEGPVDEQAARDFDALWSLPRRHWRRPVETAQLTTDLL